MDLRLVEAARAALAQKRKGDYIGIRLALPGLRFAYLHAVENDGDLVTLTVSDTFIGDVHEYTLICRADQLLSLETGRIHVKKLGSEVITNEQLQKAIDPSAP